MTKAITNMKTKKAKKTKNKFKVFITRSALDNLKQSSLIWQKRLLKALECLSNKPNYGSCFLDKYKIDIAPFKIIYLIQRSKKCVFVLAII